MINDYIKIAYRTLKERKTRSLLTVLGIFLAIVTIFVLLSLSLGLNEYVNEQFTKLGGDKFLIQAKGQLGAPGTGGAVELTTKDIDVIKRVNGIQEVAYFAIGNVKIQFKDKSRYYFAAGIPTDEKLIKLIFEASDLSIEDGRFLKNGDRKKIVLGYNYKYRNLFERPLKTGDKIKINDVDFEVIGILGAIGNPQDDQQVYITYEDFKELFNSGERVDVIWTQIKKGEDINKVAEAVKKKLMKSRGVSEKTIDFTILTPEELLKTFNNILNILTAFLIGIGSISLVVGGIGIANTMYTSVLERRKEIGTMKAIGARNSDILMIFLIESAILGLIGGLLGIFIGIIIAKSIAYIAAVYIGSDIIRASMNPLIIVGSMAFALLVGIASGLIPSYQASKLKPVDTLRYE